MTRKLQPPNGDVMPDEGSAVGRNVDTMEYVPMEVPMVTPMVTRSAALNTTSASPPSIVAQSFPCVFHAFLMRFPCTLLVAQKLRRIAQCVHSAIKHNVNIWQVAASKSHVGSRSLREMRSGQGWRKAGKVTMQM